MGHLFSAYKDIDAHPVFQPEVYEKFQDTSQPVRGGMIAYIYCMQTLAYNLSCLNVYFGALSVSLDFYS